MTEDNKPKADRDDSSRGTETSQGERSESGARGYALPKIDFSTFVLSINSSALVQLGLIEDPAGGGTTKNLPMAKQTIDILAMLEEKTKGNLTGDEEAILKNILYELRLLYVKERG
jgi:hypothetical protein